jgi:hypothetical protein
LDITKSEISDASGGQFGRQRKVDHLCAFQIVLPTFLDVHNTKRETAPTTHCWLQNEDLLCRGISAHASRSVSCDDGAVCRIKDGHFIDAGALVYHG